MNHTLGSTIEKIKLQEQNIEAKLKEKREYETALSSQNRAIREAISQAEKSDQEQLELTKRIEKLGLLLEIEKIRRDVLLSQIKTYYSMLEDLRGQSDKGITNVWRLRSSLCETVQNVSNECDIWSLLIRPVRTEPLPLVLTNKIENDEIIDMGEHRLQAALSRREKIRAERKRLLVEPETGEEFIRKVIF